MQALGDIGQWLGWTLWLLLLFASTATIFLALPGGWIALGLALLYDLLYGFQSVGWVPLIGFAALLGFGEVIEAGLGTFYVAKKGATVYGMVGGFIGGIVGAIAGSGVIPIVGTVLGGFAGAFGGAVLGEYIRQKQVEPSLRIGLHATVGRLLSVTIKFALAMAGVLWVLIQGVPQGG